MTETQQFQPVSFESERRDQYPQFPAHWQTSGIKEAFYGAYRYVPGNLPKMNPDVKAKWVEALRSGDYLQISKVLKGTRQGVFGSGYALTSEDPDTIRYCCLGVLSEIAVKDGILDGCEEIPNVPGKFRFFAHYNNSDGTKDTDALPQLWETMPGYHVQNWAGLNQDIDGYFATANDTGASFEEIADFIDAEL